MQKMSKKIDNTSVTPSSGNVFADMGLPNPEERLMKARLARLINKAIQQREWTQQQTAEALGITQPKVSDISRGRLKNFSVERLINFLAQLNHRVVITVQDEQNDLPPEEIVIAATKLEERQPVLS